MDPQKKTPEHHLAELQPPTEAEFQVLAAIWQHKEAVGLQDVCATVRQRLSLVGLPPLATTTISTYLRRLMDKGLIRTRSLGPTPQLRVGLLHPRVKPRVSLYEPTCAPSEFMQGTFENLVHAYPPEEQHSRPLLDLIESMKLAEEKAALLRLIINHDGDAGDLCLQLIEHQQLDETTRRAIAAALSKPASRSPARRSLRK